MSFSQSGGGFSGPQFSQAPDYQPYQYAKLNPMPEEQPGLFSMLAKSLGTGLGEGVAGNIQQKLKESVLEKALNQVKPNMSALEKARLLGTSGPEAEPYLNSIFQNEAAQKKIQQEQEYEQKKAQQQHQYKLIQEKEKAQYAKEKNEQQNLHKLEQIKVKPVKGSKDITSPEEHETLQESFDQISNLYASGNIGYQASWTPVESYREAKAELNSLTPILIKKIIKI